MVGNLVPLAEEFLPAFYGRYAECGGGYLRPSVRSTIIHVHGLRVSHSKSPSLLRSAHSGLSASLRAGSAAASRGLAAGFVCGMIEASDPTPLLDVGARHSLLGGDSVAGGKCAYCVGRLLG